ncbi:MAG: cytochrome c peroxidase [Betaproteobacteria bacterium]
MTGSRAAVLRRASNVAAIALVVVASLAGAALACSGNAPEPTGTETHFPLMYGDRPTVAQLSALGKRIFSDPAYSASGRQSCASCHDPRRAFGPLNALPVQPGGPALDKFGFRNTPSLRYVHAPIAFTQHFMESEVTLGQDDQGPTGGRTWDGRVNTGHDQALMPLMDANEMANASDDAVVQRLRAASYATEFRDVLSAPGEDVFDDPASALVWVTVALETYEQDAADFHPFNSKFDAYLRDEVALNPAEQRGLTLFNDMKKGNCASCHPSTRKTSTDRPPIFTDFGFAALGVPRNRTLPANRDPKFFDLGLCGPLRTDLAAHPEYCGLFRTPSLRNVALRKRFFHNGAIGSLRDAVAFYATRDTDPGRWYPHAPGAKASCDDLPPAYRANLSREIPFQPRRDGRPRLDAREIDDIVAFLGTLTDGWKPARVVAGR